MDLKGAFKHINDGDEWLAGEMIPNIDMFFCQIWLRSFVNNLENSCGRNYSKVLAVFSNNAIHYYFGKRDALEQANHIVKRLCDDPEFGKALNAKHVELSDELVEHARAVAATDLGTKTNEELARIVEEHVEIHTRLYEWGWLPVAIDMFHPVYGEMLKAYLRGKAANEEELNAFFVILTTPDRFSEEALQHQEFLDIAARIKNEDCDRQSFASGDANAIIRGMAPSLKRALEAHLEKYAPVHALWMGVPLMMEQLVQELCDYLNSGKSPAEEKEAMAADLEAKKLQKAELVKRLRVDEKYARLFWLYSEFMLLKFYRRYAQLRALFFMRPVFGEISRRLNIPESQARFLITPEYRKLLGGSFDVSQLAEREKMCALYAEKGIDYVAVGEEAQAFAAAAKPKIDLNVKEVRGQCACLGWAKGRARIVLSPADIPKMQKGDVLVAIATNPDIVMAMKRASAIVTEQGGVTCHAAIVSRELGIPCVIGTKIATRWLKDGDLIEVDANKGIVRKLE